jgi:hypothetical protein
MVHNIRQQHAGFYSTQNNVGRSLNTNQKDYSWLSPYSVKGKSTAEPFKVELKVSETIPATTSTL